MFQTLALTFFMSDNKESILDININLYKNYIAVCRLKIDYH